MAKKTRKDKEVARLRREVEVLKAQLAGEGAAGAKPLKKSSPEKEVLKDDPQVKTKGPSKSTAGTRVETKHIKADLIKSGVLTAAALAIIVALTFLL